jgi:5-methylcytosine-specific restriction endonuclease McrA
MSKSAEEKFQTACYAAFEQVSTIDESGTDYVFELIQDSVATNLSEAHDHDFWLKELITAISEATDLQKQEARELADAIVLQMQIVHLLKSPEEEAAEVAAAEAKRKPEVGAVGSAVLAVDGDWHPCVVIEDDKNAEDSVLVRFVEYGVEARVLISELRLEHEIVGDEEEGLCPICDREMPLTFHHLIPRTTHEKYLKKGYTMKQLSTGVMLCRPCHSAVHKAEDEFSLAADWNTLEKILTHPDVIKWQNYAKKQKGIKIADAQKNLRRKR